MSSRALKKILKEEIKPVFSSEEDASEEEEVNLKPKKNLFDLLDNEEPDFDEAEDDTATGNDGHGNDTVLKKEDFKREESTSNDMPLKEEDNKLSQSEIAKEKEDTTTDIVEYLKETKIVDDFSETKNVINPSASKNLEETEKSKKLKNLLKIERKFLDSEQEIKRIFGSSSTTSQPKQRNTRSFHTRKYLIANPPNNGAYWPELPRIGLELKQNTITHSKSYQQLETQFFQLVQSLNPQSLQLFLQSHPSHVSTLVLLSYSLVQTGDFASSFDLLQRAFVVFEKSGVNLVKLTYDNYCNRMYFIALFLQCFLLTRKGCWRTAFECCKVLYLCQDEEDSMCCLLFIDFLAIRAEEYDFVLDFYECKFSDDVGVYVNWLYSRALALFMRELKVRKVNSKKKDVVIDSINIDEYHKESSSLLKEAIEDFPWIMVKLFEKNGFSCPLVVDEPTYDAFSLLTDLYVVRNHSLWKLPEVQSWCNLVSKSIESFNPSVQVTIPYSFYRHIFLTDWTNSSTTTGSSDQLTKYIPKQYINGTLPWGLQYTLISDPFPPKSIKPYNTYFKKQFLVKYPYATLSILLKERSIDEILKEFEMKIDDFPDALRDVIDNLTLYKGSVWGMFMSFVDGMILPWSTGNGIDEETKAFLLGDY